MPLVNAALFLLLAFPTAATVAPDSLSGPVRMIRSQSGPSGKIAGLKFVLDELRNRFVYPQDGSLTVTFECAAPAGDHLLHVYWKDPEGRIVGISPDLKMHTTTDELNSYWTLMLDGNRPGGIWTAELRIDGAPVGSHSFELVVPHAAAPTPSPAPAPTLDELYRSVSKSLVWIHKLDGAGHRLEMSSGFVVAAGLILTSFGSIDMASGLEVELADGSATTTYEIAGCNRAQDWALVKGDTKDVPPLQFGSADSIVIGEQLIAFSSGSGSSRIIGAIDVSGRATLPGLGPRVYFQPALPTVASGGPLLSLHGKVVGVIGGGATPGASLAPQSLRSLRESISPTGSAVPLSERTIAERTSPGMLAELLRSGVLTAPLSPTPSFGFGVTTDHVPEDFQLVERTRFTRKDKVMIYTTWKKVDSSGAGTVTMRVYDAQNRLAAEGRPQDLKLSGTGSIQYVTSFSAASVPPGPYRIDVLWNSTPAWRTFITIIE